MNRFILSSIFVLSFVIATSAQKIEFKAIAPPTVVAGEPFQLQYSVNSGEAEKFKMPDIKNFEQISIPSTFTSNEFAVVNGKQIQRTVTSYSYVLMADKQGTFSIAPASVSVRGKEYKSNSLSIKVLPKSEKKREELSTKSTPKDISNSDLFVRAIVSKSKVREQESVMITYKLYFGMDMPNVDLLGNENFKSPNYRGFMTTNIDNSKKPIDYENYNGRNYSTIVLEQIVLTPQQTGNLVISPMSLTSILRVRQLIRDPRSIFGSYTVAQTIKKNISSGTVTINVQPLPEPKPKDFSGAVGSFSMTSSISTTETSENNSVTLKINIKGEGNLKLIKTPEVKFPQDFETYDPKVNNNFSVSGASLSGSKTIEYLVIPRHSGRFEIPSVELSYFDLSTNSYKTLKSQTYTLNVSKSSDKEAIAVSNFGGAEQERVKQLSSDIKYIYTGELKVMPAKTIFAGSLLFWILLFAPLVIAIFLGMFFRKKIIENSNIALVRNRRANKVAKNRLKVAESFLKDSNKSPFYDEILSALLLYLSDKFNMPISSLNRDNVHQQMTSHKIDSSVTDEFMTLLSDCELERYAPLQQSQNSMETIYNRTVEMIEKLENRI